MIIDTHLHLVDRKRLSYPWLSDVPALDLDWSYDDYQRAAMRLGIEGALHMEVDVAESDIDSETQMVRDLMGRKGGLMLGAISSARPENNDFEAWLEGVDRSIVKGLRRVLHVVDDGVSQTDRFRANVARLGNAGLPFDICMLARQLPLAKALVDACPDTSFVLDHCGVPDIAAGGYDGWARDITELSKRPNIAAKISGITAYTGDDWTAETLRPYVHHIIESFGWSRVVWGSDSPVCTLKSSLDQWVGTTHALLSGTSESERTSLFSSNAKRIWSL